MWLMSGTLREASGSQLTQEVEVSGDSIKYLVDETRLNLNRRVQEWTGNIPNMSDHGPTGVGLLLPVVAAPSAIWARRSLMRDSRALSFIAHQPVENHRFRLDRGENADRTIEYDIPCDATERPPGHLHDSP